MATKKAIHLNNRDWATNFKPSPIYIAPLVFGDTTVWFTVERVLLDTCMIWELEITTKGINHDPNNRKLIFSPVPLELLNYFLKNKSGTCTIYISAIFSSLFFFGVQKLQKKSWNLVLCWSTYLKYSTKYGYQGFLKCVPLWWI